MCQFTSLLTEHFDFKKGMVKRRGMTLGVLYTHSGARFGCLFDGGQLAFVRYYYFKL